jgi:hypothetical protein
VSAAERERAFLKLLELDYDFFHCLSLVPSVHPCVAEQLHADFAIEYRYDLHIRDLSGMTLANAERIIDSVRSVFPNAEAFVHASAWVRTLVSIHGGEWGEAASEVRASRAVPSENRE